MQSAHLCYIKKYLQDSLSRFLKKKVFLCLFVHNLIEAFSQNTLMNETRGLCVCVYLVYTYISIYIFKIDSSYLCD